MTDRFTFHPDRLDRLPDGSWDDGNVREWLADPEFSFAGDTDGYPADTLLQAAQCPDDNGEAVIGCPAGMSLWLDYSDDADGPMYEIRVTNSLPEGQALRLAGIADDYPPTRATGREAITDWLNEAVSTGNGILDSLAAWRNI